MYSDSAPPPVDPYSDAYNALPPAPAAPMDSAPREPAPRGRSRSRSPGRSAGYRSPPPYRNARRPSPPPRRPPHAPVAPNPSNVLGVFGLSIRTTERDLDDEFGKFGRVEKVTIVYDQRSDRSRGFGFIKMDTVEAATRCIQELNGIDLNGRRIRVDYSVTDRPHAPTPGEYMGHRSSGRDSYYGGAGGGGREGPPRNDRRDRDRDFRDRDFRERRGYGGGGGGYDRDRDRDPYGRDNRDWRDRRSPPPRSGRGYSPDHRRRRSYSRSPPRGSSPGRPRDYDPPAANGGDSRW